MSAPIRLVQFPSYQAARAAHGGWVPPGSVWNVDPERLARPAYQAMLSAAYRARATDRPPVFVKLPTGEHFCPDARQVTASGSWGADGFTVDGDPPRLSVAELIEVDGWRGYIRDGWLLTIDADGVLHERGEARID